MQSIMYVVGDRGTHDLLPNLLSTPTSGTSPDKKFDDKFLEKQHQQSINTIYATAQLYTKE